MVDAVQLWLDMLDTTKVVYWRNIIDADILGKNSREKRNVDSTLLIPYHIRLMMLCGYGLENYFKTQMHCRQASKKLLRINLKPLRQSSKGLN